MTSEAAAPVLSNEAAPTPPTPPSLLLQQLRAASIVCTLALVALALAWELWLAPTGQRTLALKALPLALALPGLVRHRLYTYRWLSLLLWLYVLEGLLRSTTEGGVSMVLAVIEVVLAVALFTCTSLYIRRRLRGAPAAATTEPTAPAAPT